MLGCSALPFRSSIRLSGFKNQVLIAELPEMAFLVEPRIFRGNSTKPIRARMYVRMYGVSMNIRNPLCYAYK